METYFVSYDYNEIGISRWHNFLQWLYRLNDIFWHCRWRKSRPNDSISVRFRVRYHIRTWTKWPPFCTYHYQMYFSQMKSCILIQNSLKCVPQKNSIHYKLLLVYVNEEVFYFELFVSSRQFILWRIENRHCCFNIKFAWPRPPHTRSFKHQQQVYTECCILKSYNVTSLHCMLP